MNILITGGAGFIGSHLSEQLLSNGHSVICMDDFTSGTKHNIQHLLKNKRFTFIHHDILKPIKNKLKIDQIYNLACPASPPQYQQDPVRTFRINTEGSINVLNLGIRTNARILQASTSEVYGDPEIHPQPESYSGSVNITGVRACYDEGKRGAETLFFDYYRKYGVDIRVVRIFNTYGPRMKAGDGRVIPNFIKQALQNEDVTIYGDGKQTRSFQYIDDLINGLVRSMNNDYPTQPINLGNPEEYTMQQLAEKIISMVPQSQSTIVYQDLPSDDPKRRQPDISKARELLGWSPIVSLDEGLIKTIRSYTYDL